MERTGRYHIPPRNPNPPPNQRAVEQVSRETWSTSQRCAHLGRNVGHRSQPLQRSNHDMERDTYTARTTASIWDKTRPTCNDQPQWRSCLLGEPQGWRDIGATYSRLQMRETYLPSLFRNWGIILLVPQCQWGEMASCERTLQTLSVKLQVQLKANQTPNYLLCTSYAQRLFLPQIDSHLHTCSTYRQRMAKEHLVNTNR